jgi:hypothetical protein
MGGWPCAAAVYAYVRTCARESVPCSYEFVRSSGCPGMPHRRRWQLPQAQVPKGRVGASVSQCASARSCAARVFFRYRSIDISRSRYLAIASSGGTHGCSPTLTQRSCGRRRSPSPAWLGWRTCRHPPSWRRRCAQRLVAIAASKCEGGQSNSRSAALHRAIVRFSASAAQVEPMTCHTARSQIRSCRRESGAQSTKDRRRANVIAPASMTGLGAAAAAAAGAGRALPAFRISSGWRTSQSLCFPQKSPAEATNGQGLPLSCKAAQPGLAIFADGTWP